MEGVLAVLRPKSGVSGLEYRPRSYDILLLDNKVSNGDKGRPSKCLPMFFLKVVDDDPRDIVLNELYKLTGGEHGSGIKGENTLGESMGQVSKVRIHWESMGQVSKVRIHWGESRGQVSKVRIHCGGSMGQVSKVRNENTLGESMGQVSKVRIHWGRAWVRYQR